MEEARTRSAVQNRGAVADDGRVLSVSQDIEPSPSQTSPVRPTEEARTRSAVQNRGALAHDYDGVISAGLMREYDTIHDDTRDLNVSYDDTVSLSSSVSIDDVDNDNDDEHRVIRAVDFADLLSRRL